MKQEHPEHICAEKNKITHECQTTKNAKKKKDSKHKILRMQQNNNHNTLTQKKSVKILPMIIKTIYSRNNAMHTAIQKRFFKLQSIIVL